MKIELDGSASYDPESGKIASYNWEFGDGHTGSGMRVRHAYQDPGNFIATLTVRDQGGLEGVAHAPARIRDYPARFYTEQDFCPTRRRARA